MCQTVYGFLLYWNVNCFLRKARVGTETMASSQVNYMLITGVLCVSYSIIHHSHRLDGLVDTRAD